MRGTLEHPAEQWLIMASTEAIRSLSEAEAASEVLFCVVAGWRHLLHLLPDRKDALPVQQRVREQQRRHLQGADWVRIFVLVCAWKSSCVVCTLARSPLCS